MIDHTELMLRQHGVAGQEGFVVWAGTLAGGDAFVSTLVCPACARAGRLHGEVRPRRRHGCSTSSTTSTWSRSPRSTAIPREAFLSAHDAQRPVVAVRGFLSIVIPSFGFVDLADVGVWRAYEFHGREQWRELERRRATRATDRRPLAAHDRLMLVLRPKLHALSRPARIGPQQLEALGVDTTSRRTARPSASGSPRAATAEQRLLAQALAI